MAQTARKIKVASNPSRRNATPRANAQRKTRRKNTMTAAKKKAFVARMARARKAKPTTSHRRRTKRAKNPTSTPVASARRNPRAKRSSRRRNPTVRNGLTNIIGSPKNLATQAVVGLLSAVATRQIPQMILKSNNVGWQGYAANAAAAVASAWAAGEFISPQAGQAALIGGTVILLDRVLTEKVSPIGKYLSLAGIGDATAAPSLGTIADGYFIHPTVVDSTGRPIIPHEITDASLAAARAEFGPRLLPQHSMAGVPQGSSRFASRFR